MKYHNSVAHGSSIVIKSKNPRGIKEKNEGSIDLHEISNRSAVIKYKSLVTFTKDTQADRLRLVIRGTRFITQFALSLYKISILLLVRAKS